MNKTILLIAIVFAIASLTETFAQDIYHDGNYSNGEKVEFSSGHYFLVKGKIEKVDKIEGGIDGIILINVSEARIKTSFFSTEIKIDRIIPTLEILYYYAEPSEKIYFFDCVIDIQHQNITVLVDKGLKIYFKKIFLFDSNYFTDNICYSIQINNKSDVEYIFFSPLEFDELSEIRLKAILGNNSRTLLPFCNLGISLNKGGFFEINHSKFIFFPKESIEISKGFDSFKFIPKKEVVFEAIGGLNNFEKGCMILFPFTEAVKESRSYIKSVNGKFLSFSIGDDLKIIDGELEIDGTKIKGENFYFLSSVRTLEEFEDQELKNNGAVFFDRITKTLLVSDKANLQIVVNGEEIEFYDGKPTKITPSFLEVYRLHEKKDILHKRGEVLVRKIEAKGKIVEIKVDEKIVGRTIFSAPEGMVVIDIAPIFLKKEIDSVKREVFEEKVIHKIPSKIRVTDLRAKIPYYSGVYYSSSATIEITRQGLDDTILVHEILHHFFRQKGKQKEVEQAMRKFMKDEQLTEAQKRTREKLIERLKAWEEHYKPKNDKEYFERIVCVEGYSVIGEWLYGEKIGDEDVSFPDYVLDLYKEILRPEIIEKGK
ncbi:MAG: hypothetical protein QXW65_00205 [Candidatus Pacearchaeota archaeon]